MVSSSHEHLVELFRNCSELAPALLQACAHLELPHERAELGSVDATQALPVEYRADQVVRLYAPDNRVSAAVIVEVQLGRDARKRYSWPVYLAALRARLRCPAILLVIAPDKAVATWARRLIAIGHPGFGLSPVVLSSEDIPHSFDPDGVAKLPELAVLAALTHVDRETISAAADAICYLPEDDRKLYWGFIQHALNKHAQTANLELEADMGKLKYDPVKMEQFATEWADIMLSNRLFTHMQNILCMVLESKLGPLDEWERYVVFETIYDAEEINRVCAAVLPLTDVEQIRAVLGESDQRSRDCVY